MDGAYCHNIEVVASSHVTNLKKKKQIILPLVRCFCSESLQFTISIKSHDIEFPFPSVLQEYHDVRLIHSVLLRLYNFAQCSLLVACSLLVLNFLFNISQDFFFNENVALSLKGLFSLLCMK